MFGGQPTITANEKTAEDEQEAAPSEIGIRKTLVVFLIYYCHYVNSKGMVSPFYSFDFLRLSGAQLCKTS